MKKARKKDNNYLKMVLRDGLRFTPQLTERQEEARDGLEITAAEKFTAAVRHLNIM